MPGRKPGCVAALAARAVLPLLLVAIPGCYKAAPLDEAALLREIRERPAGRAPAGGAAADTLSAPLTEADAIALAASGSPALRVERARIEVARADVRKARRLENPEIRVSNGWEEDVSFGEDRLTLDFRWSPDPLPEYLAGIRAAEALVPVREGEAAQRAWEIRREVRLAWNDAAFERAGLRLEVERASLWKAMRDRLASAPGSDPLTRLRAEMDGAAAMDRARRLQEQESRALASLARLLGLGSAAGLAVDVGPRFPECPVPDASLTSRLDAAAVDHPSVRLARAAHALAEAELRIEVSKQIPWARWIQVGWGYQPKTDNGVTTYRNQLRIGIALDLPILDWNQGGVAAGKARRYREAQRFREALAEVAGAADEATGRWTAARERVEHLRTEAVPIAEKSVAATSEAVAGGRLSQTDLLKARLQAMEIQEALLEATKACREAAIDAEAALGVPLPEVPPAPANP